MQLHVQHCIQFLFQTCSACEPPQHAHSRCSDHNMLAACRAFTTLSETLGHMATSLHHGLAQGVQQEGAALVLAAQLRALQSLVAAAPYHRLPAVLPCIISTVRPSTLQASVCATAVNCRQRGCAWQQLKPPERAGLAAAPARCKLQWHLIWTAQLLY